MKSAIGFSLALVLYANGFALFLFQTGLAREWFYLPLSVILLLVSAWWARRKAQLGWAEMGVTHAGAAQSAAVGALAGIALAGPALLFFAFPFLLANEPRYAEIERLSAAGLLWRIGVEATIATALTEEFVFRGILQALFKRVLSTARALVAVNIVFALWHAVTNALTLQQNVVTLPFMPILLSQAFGYVGSLLVVAFGGIAFSLIRERTHHLAGCVVAHWVSVGAMTVTLYT